MYFLGSTFFLWKKRKVTHLTSISSPICTFIISFQKSKFYRICKICVENMYLSYVIHLKESYHNVHNSYAMYCIESIDNYFNSRYYFMLLFLYFAWSIADNWHKLDMHRWPTVNKESKEFEGSWCLLNLCVGTAVGNKISIRWLTEKITLCQKIELFWIFCTKYLNFLSCCIWCYLFWEMSGTVRVRGAHVLSSFVLLRLLPPTSAVEEQIIYIC